MRIPRIFTEQALTAGAEIQLEEQASNHLSRVLRMQEGRSVIVFNGQGGQFNATISAIKKKAVLLSLDEYDSHNQQSPLQSELAIAISKGDRMEWVVQKATELGIHRITPLTTENSQLKLNAERAQKKHHQWQQIAISACEQCGRNIVPEVAPIIPLQQWLSTVKADKKLVLHHRSSEALTAEKPDSVALLIGPEGGLSTTEIDTALQHGFKALTLGPRILRTETAPLTALSIMQFQWGDF